MIKTKLVVTVGPACRSESVLTEMIDLGVDVFRFNFSHGTLQEHRDALTCIRRIAADRDRPVAALGDLCGPKIRLGMIAGGRCELVEDTSVSFVGKQIEGDSQHLWSNYPALIDDVEPGHRVLIDDGCLRLRAVSKTGDALICRCEVGGTVSNHKGINLPDTHISAPALTEKDLVDLAWAVESGLDYVALSFVRRPNDVNELRRRLDGKDADMRIIAKIEKPQAVDHIDSIIEFADGVMVARGDLGVEMELACVPIVQKEIALRAQAAGKPVIIATQMLQSMVDHPSPTRAEVSDVANAILDGADAVMLSAESSVGRFPTDAVRQLRAIAEQTESFGLRYGAQRRINQATHLPVETAILHGVSVVTRELNPALVVIWTESGQTAAMLSKHRLPVPILALTSRDRTYRQLAISYGVIPILHRRADTFAQMLRELDDALLKRQLARRGDRIIVADDAHPEVAGETDAFYIHMVG